MVTMIGSTALMSALTVIPYPQHVVTAKGAFALPMDRVEKSDVSWRRDASIPAEGYRLSVTPNGVTAWSSDDAGAFYALQTLKQMARPQDRTVEVEVTEVFQGSIRLERPRTVKKRIHPLELPCCEIEDAPRFKYRGFMLDEARHFMGKEIVKKYLDLMSEAKMNVFHWHLTDDEGWRLEIKRHPEVHKKGSVRPQSMCHGSTEDNLFWNGEKYGPFFYTHEEVREIVAYAAERHITVIPEIDVPAHSRALFVSHPEFTCIGSNETFKHPWMVIGPQYECFCAANEEGMKFIEDILDEVCELFPSRQIHIGGDECPPNRWRECPKCQALMKRLGIAPENAGALQTRMTHRFAKFLAERGREAIAWDEVLSADMPKNLVMQLWRDGNDGRLAAEAGLDVIMSPSDRTYFTRPQNIPDDPHQTTAGENSAVTLHAVFAWDPTEGMAPNVAKRVRGVECCSWAECTWGWFDLNWKMWPRSFATAEIAWTGARRTDFEDFLRRLAPLRKRLIKQHIGAAPITVHRDRRIIAAEALGQGGAGRYSPIAFLRSAERPDKFADAAFFTTLVPSYDGGADVLSPRKGHSQFGEIVDVVDVGAKRAGGLLAELSRYKAVFLVGGYAPKSVDAMALAEYVKNGGTLFVSADQVLDGVVPADLAGVLFTGERKPCYEVVKNEQGYRIFQIYRCYGAYSLYVGRESTAKPFLTDGRGKTAAWANAFGRGKVYTVACRRMMPDDYADKENGPEQIKPIAAGLRVFQFVRYLLERVQNDVVPVTVTGDIQGGLDTTDKGWLLRMANSKECVSRVAVNLKALKGAKVVELTPDGGAEGVKVDVDVFTTDVAPRTALTFAIE